MTYFGGLPEDDLFLSDITILSVSTLPKGERRVAIDSGVVSS